MNKIINQNSKILTEQISVSLLKIDMPFHLKSHFQNIKYLAEYWTNDRYTPIFVSFRDGIYHVIDGKQRLLAVKMRFPERKHLECHVRYDLTSIDEEVKWFKELDNNDNKYYSLAENHFSKFDDKWKFILDAVKKSELEVLHYRTKYDNVISCLATLEKIYNDFIKFESDSDFENMLYMLKNCCLGTKESLTSNFLKGFAVFYRAYKYKIDKQILQKIFYKTDENAKIQYIYLSAFKNIQNGTEKFKADYTKIGKASAMAIKELYNKNIKKQEKKLKTSLIELLNTDL